MNVEPLSKADFDEILNRLDLFWGDRSLAQIHHPIFLYEFGDTAFVIRDAKGVSAYLYGFLAQTSKTAYIHLISVRPDLRRQGLAQKLYTHFFAEARKRGAERVKAMTKPDNLASIRFHQSLGFKLLGELNEAGVPVILNYRGLGQHRVVFERHI